ncbi:hypothetical protein MY11210_006523 [Beauveria gryllotalpidicola]
MHSPFQRFSYAAPARRSGAWGHDERTQRSQCSDKGQEKSDAAQAGQNKKHGPKRLIRGMSPTVATELLNWLLLNAAAETASPTAAPKQPERNQNAYLLRGHVAARLFDAYGRDARARHQNDVERKKREAKSERAGGGGAGAEDAVGEENGPGGPRLVPTRQTRRAPRRRRKAEASVLHESPGYMAPPPQLNGRVRETAPD